MSPPAAAADRAPAASLTLRVAALVYEGVLIFGVAFAAALVALLAVGREAAGTDAARHTVQAAVFLALGAYFCWCWTRSGQTLAAKTWRLRVVDGAGRLPTWRRAIGRYLAGWTLFVPGLVYIAAAQPGRAGAFLALGVSVVLMLLPALASRQRLLLHDLLSGTRLVREPLPARPREPTA